ncbi:uncharacterized protein ACO6RY_20122 [Pungitius sinensis]
MLAAHTQQTTETRLLLLLFMEGRRQIDMTCRGGGGCETEGSLDKQGDGITSMCFPCVSLFNLIYFHIHSSTLPPRSLPSSLSLYLRPSLSAPLPHSQHSPRITLLESTPSISQTSDLLFQIDGSRRNSPTRRLCSPLGSPESGPSLRRRNHRCRQQLEFPAPILPALPRHLSWTLFHFPTEPFFPDSTFSPSLFLPSLLLLLPLISSYRIAKGLLKAPHGPSTWYL